jgi:translation initiation factor IF-1
MSVEVQFPQIVPEKDMLRVVVFDVQDARFIGHGSVNVLQRRPGSTRTSAEKGMGKTPRRRRISLGKRGGVRSRKTCCAPHVTCLYSALRFSGNGPLEQLYVPGVDVIRLAGTVVEVLKQATLFRVELVNGHRLLGHVSPRRRQEAAALRPGDQVNLEMSAFDFSKGRIVLEETRK